MMKVDSTGRTSCIEKSSTPQNSPISRGICSEEYSAKESDIPNKTNGIIKKISYSGVRYRDGKVFYFLPKSRLIKTKE